MESIKKYLDKFLEYLIQFTPDKAFINKENGILVGAILGFFLFLFLSSYLIKFIKGDHGSKEKPKSTTPKEDEKSSTTKKK